MKNSVDIYKTDIKNIVTNWAMLIIVVALMILPSLYAWFNIKASWDPYGNTRGIKIAVTNEDKGAIIQDEHVNVGKDVIASLKKNKSLGWTFVNKKEAIKGVQRGDYYASIVIPQDFSEKIGTVLEERLEKPVLTYTVNEKINAIVPKITSKGASSLTEEISKNFIETANGAIFALFNEIGIKLEQDLPAIKQIESRIFELEKRMPEIKKVVNEAVRATNKAEELVNQAKWAIPVIEQLTADGAAVTKQLNDFLTKTDQAFETISPNIKSTLIALQSRANQLQKVKEELAGEQTNSEQTKVNLQQTINLLTQQINDMNAVIRVLNQLNDLAPNEPLARIISKLELIENSFSQQLSIAKNLEAAINKGEQLPSEMIERFHQTSNEGASQLNGVLSRYNHEIIPAIDQAAENAKSKTKKAYELLTEANKSLPDISSVLQSAAHGVRLGQAELKNLQQNFPAIEQKVRDIANKIREFQQTQDIQAIIDLLKNDVEKESDFFAEPVLLKEKRLYPIPNYGSAMSPFFTTLSLWVGALLLVSLLRVEVEGAYKSRDIYLGRLFTFVSIALFQAFIVTLGDIFILKAYVVDKMMFVLFGLFISTVFMTMVYTFVSVFGNAGKAIAIVLLVLQLSAAGGTFPIQVTPPFFQAINPFLPFTYAISMMREAVGGMLVDIVRRDFLVLLVILIGTLLFGLFLRKPLSNISKRLTEKAHESKLIH
ncbi:YhgE/Pip domain-containing protein [Priestia megaterium]|nr:YhgE/Pip domain-containing protein [Priestia megaterium]